MSDDPRDQRLIPPPRPTKHIRVKLHDANACDVQIATLQAQLAERDRTIDELHRKRSMHLDNLGLAWREVGKWQATAERYRAALAAMRKHAKDALDANYGYAPEDDIEKFFVDEIEDAIAVADAALSGATQPAAALIDEIVADSHAKVSAMSDAEVMAEVERRGASPEQCHAQKDGDCWWSGCPQRRDSEPETSGRHCPLDAKQPTPGDAE